MCEIESSLIKYHTCFEVCRINFYSKEILEALFGDGVNVESSHTEITYLDSSPLKQNGCEHDEDIWNVIVPRLQAVLELLPFEIRFKTTRLHFS